jgi:hypothetical protein
MTTESNEPQLNAQPQRAPKRAWSAPRVIESDLSDTQTPRPSAVASRDYVYFLNFGS